MAVSYYHVFDASDFNIGIMMRDRKEDRTKNTTKSARSVKHKHLTNVLNILGSLEGGEADSQDMTVVDREAWFRTILPCVSKKSLKSRYP